jgi:hypothetical protein
MKLTLPDGSFTNFGPIDYANGAAVAFVGTSSYTTALADLAGGAWTAKVDWIGVLQDGFDGPSSGQKQLAINRVTLPPTVVTTSSPTGGNVAPGTSVSDSATVTGSGPTPTGTVKFFLCQPSEVTAGGCEGTAGTQIGTPAAGETLVAGTVASEASTNTTTVGKYCWRAEYSGDGFYLAGSHTNATTECFTVAADHGLITHTNVSCGDVLSGAASLPANVIGQINYPGTTTIGQGINPGKFFFWTKIVTTVPNQVVTVTQSKTGTGAALFGIHQDWQRVYTGNCASYQTGTQINGGTGASFTIATPGSYIIGIKYDPKSLVGKPVPVPATVTYSFATSLGGTTGASVLLGPG